MTNETTPDAVERQYQDSDGNPCDLVTLCRRDPEWAANRLTFERARHAEEVERLRRERQAFGMRIEELETREDDLAVELAEVRRRMCRAFGVSESATWAELESLATTRGNGEEAYD